VAYTSCFLLPSITHLLDNIKQKMKWKKKTIKKWKERSFYFLLRETLPRRLCDLYWQRADGDATKNQVAMNPTNSIYFQHKRLVGRKYRESETLSSSLYETLALQSNFKSREQANDICRTQRRWELSNSPLWRSPWFWPRWGKFAEAFLCASVKNAAVTDWLSQLPSMTLSAM
jgi:hypothetical protein